MNLGVTNEKNGSSAKKRLYITTKLFLVRLKCPSFKDCVRTKPAVWFLTVPLSPSVNLSNTMLNTHCFILFYSIPLQIGAPTHIPCVAPASLHSACLSTFIFVLSFLHTFLDSILQ